VTATPTADQATAIATAIAALFAGWSARQARGAAKAAKESADAALKGIVAQTEGIHAMTFTYLESYEREIKLPAKKEALKLLQSDGTLQDVTDQKLQDVLDIINFVNLLAHVTRNHYVEPQPLLRRHTPIIRDCERRVIGSGWLAAYRDKQIQPVLFLNFQALCMRITWK
jgi:hypothetical protein